MDENKLRLFTLGLCVHLNLSSHT